LLDDLTTFGKFRLLTHYERHLQLTTLQQQASIVYNCLVYTGFCIFTLV